MAQQRLQNNLRNGIIFSIDWVVIAVATIIFYVYLNGIYAQRANGSTFNVDDLVPITLVERQRDRYLPMPDYDLSEPGEVSLTIPGTVLDEDYSLMLIKHTDLDLETAILLDRVQKHKPLSAEAVKELRKRNLVEGRKNALIVAKSVAQATEQEVEYTRAKGFTDEFCMDLIEKAVQEHERLSRPKIDELITPYLSSALDEEQKYRKIGNLLTKLKTDGRIHLGHGKMWMPGPEN